MDHKEKKCDNREINNLIDKSIKNNVFSACSFGYLIHSCDGQKFGQYHYGYDSLDKNSLKTSHKTFYDLASLTKPLVTSLCFLKLKKDNKINENNKLKDFFCDIPKDKENISIENLLNHSSGLASHRPYFQTLIKIEEKKRKEFIKNKILNEKLVNYPGEKKIYSDLGYIILGEIIEIASGKKLDEYWKEIILYPLGLEKDFLFTKNKEHFSVTGICPWSGQQLCGIVHDDNSRSLEGVTGHAGLFGTLQGVLRLCGEILKSYAGISEKPLFDKWLFEKEFKLEKNNDLWVYGFDTPSEETSSCGKLFSTKSIGHLGFTGTSFWIDLEKNIVIVLLTNRVLCENGLYGIKQLRPLLHDAVLKKLLQTTS